MIRLFIADDHPLVRAGFRQLVAEEPDFEVVGEAVDGHDLLTQLAATPTDVVVLDVTMPGPGFLPLLGRLREAHPAVRVLVVSVHPEGEMALRALQAGAAGYVDKTRTGAELVAALRKVHAGGNYVTPSLAERLAAELATGRIPSPRHGLSAREHDVLRLLGAGKSNKEVAAIFRVSPKTVSTYRSRILRKLRLRTNADLVRYALEQGLIA
jgi:two-component system, NarL family, invasion response regulator UvrY